MWNQIRTPPFIGVGPGNSPSFIAAGFQSQYGIETNIIMVMCTCLVDNAALIGADGVLAFSFYTLAVTVPSMKDPARQRLAGYTWTGILVVAMGALTGIFRAKQPGCVADVARPSDSDPATRSTCASGGRCGITDVRSLFK